MERFKVRYTYMRETMAVPRKVMLWGHDELAGIKYKSLSQDHVPTPCRGLEFAMLHILQVHE